MRTFSANLIAELEARRSQRTPEELAERAGEMLSAICLDPRGARRGASESLPNIWENATHHILAGRTGPARNTLDAFMGRVESAHRQGALSEVEHRLLLENAAYLRDRLSAEVRRARSSL